MMGEDDPDPTGVFHWTFWPGPKRTGGLPPPSPEEFSPLNWGHHSSPPLSAAPAELERATMTRKMIHVGFILNAGSQSVVQVSLRQFYGCSGNIGKEGIGLVMSTQQSRRERVTS
jgi:hypothetical protein